jgi:hypothetical protein
MVTGVDVNLMLVLSGCTCEANAQARFLAARCVLTETTPRLLVLAHPTLNGAALHSGFWERLRLARRSTNAKSRWHNSKAQQCHRRDALDCQRLTTSQGSGSLLGSNSRKEAHSKSIPDAIVDSKLSMDLAVRTTVLRTGLTVTLHPFRDCRETCGCYGERSWHLIHNVFRVP